MGLLNAVYTLHRQVCKVANKSVRPRSRARSGGIVRGETPDGKDFYPYISICDMMGVNPLPSKNEEKVDESFRYPIRKMMNRDFIMAY